jgi:hypothetical protein
MEMLKNNNEETKINEKTRYPKRNKDSSYVNPYFEKNIANENKNNENKQNYLDVLDFLYSPTNLENLRKLIKLQKELKYKIEHQDYNGTEEFENLYKEYDKLENIRELIQGQGYIDRKNMRKEKEQKELSDLLNSIEQNKKELKELEKKTRSNYQKKNINIPYSQNVNKNQLQNNYNKLFNTNTNNSVNKKQISPPLLTNRERKIIDNKTIKYTVNQLTDKINYFKKNNPNLDYKHLPSRPSKDQLLDYMNYYNIKL